MKNKYEISFASLMLSLFVLSIDAAIDPDIQSKSGLALKQYAQKLKALPPAPAHYGNLAPGGAATSTELLLVGKQEANNSKYIAELKLELVAAVDTWLDTVLSTGGGDKFSKAIKQETLGNLSNYPQNRTKAAFLVAVTKVINEFYPTTRPIANAQFSTMFQTTKSINVEISTVVCNWIDTLLPAGDDAKLLLGVAPQAPLGVTKPAVRTRGHLTAIKPAVRTRGHLTAIKPAVRTRGYFKTAIKRLIDNFSY